MGTNLKSNEICETTLKPFDLRAWKSSVQGSRKGEYSKCNETQAWRVEIDASVSARARRIRLDGVALP